MFLVVSYQPEYVILTSFDAESPEILKLFERRNLEEGQKLTITCSTTKGSKPLTFEWLKEGVHLTNSKYRIANDEDFSLLKIDTISAKDAGNFSCKASNAFGSDKHVFDVHVKQTPHWIVEPRDVPTKVGADIKIECRASGLPQPVISWFKHGKPNRFLTSGDFLELYDVQHTSAGFYECTADNGIDKPMKKIFRIDVNGMNFLI